MTPTARRDEIVDRVKTIMRRDLKLGPDIPIEMNMPFFGGEADIDSLDVLLLLTSIEREFGFKIPSEEIGRKVFENFGSLCDYLDKQLQNVPETKAIALPEHGLDRLAKLPHGPPFRFVTRVEKIVEGESAEGVWVVDGTEDFFRGHFPEHPIVPGALIAEALAQLSGIARSRVTVFGKLAKIDVRFEEVIVPPAEIRLSAKVARSIASLIQYQVEASCGGKTAARGTITLSWGSNGSASPDAG